MIELTDCVSTKKLIIGVTSYHVTSAFIPLFFLARCDSFHKKSQTKDLVFYNLDSKPWLNIDLIQKKYDK